MKKTKKRLIKDFLLLNLGILLISITFVFIMSPNNAVYGGVQGISIILNHFINFSNRASYFLFGLNFVLLIIGLLLIGKGFFLKTLYATLASFIYAWALEWALTDSVLTAIRAFFAENGFLFVIVGAVTTGFGLGLAFKSGASTGGVDVLQAVFLKYLKIPYSKSLIIIDGTIVLIGSLLLYGNNGVMFLENVCYALVFILVEGYITDAVAFSGFQVKSIYIISDKKDEIKKYIIEKLSRGVTEVPSFGGYTGDQKTMLLCVLPNNNYYDLKDYVMTIDPTAFIYATRAAEVHGEGFSYDGNDQ